MTYDEIIEQLEITKSKIKSTERTCSATPATG